MRTPDCEGAKLPSGAGFRKRLLRTTRHVSNAQDHDPRRVRAGRRRTGGIGRASAARYEHWPCPLRVPCLELAPEGLQWLRFDRERLARLSGCHARCSRRLPRSAPKRSRCNEPSPLPQTSEQGCDLLVRRHLAAFDFGQGLIDVGTLLVREVVDALGPVLQDEQHLGRLFLPVEGPLARALENRVDLFPGHVLMIINPTETENGGGTAIADPQGGAEP